tara:strand:+ start:3819 stop:4931 length:1113 start_codon:yes stop_codon:yes gene_type:complete
LARGVSIDADNSLAGDLAAAADVVVSERMGHPARFELQLPAPVKRQDIPALTDGRLDPGKPLSIFVEDGAGGIDCLVSGPVDGHAIRLVHGSGNSRLTVLGGDASVAMDLEMKVRQWTGPDGPAVMAICGEYAVPCLPAGPVMARMSMQHPLVQRATDLAFLRRLAQRNGCQFWIRPMAARVGPVVNQGFFQPITFSDGNLPVLRMNAKAGGEKNTIDSLDIEFATDGPTAVKAGGVEISGVSDFTADTDLSGMDPLGRTPVDRIGPTPRTTRLTVAGDGASDLEPRGSAVLAEAQFFISATTATTAKRLGRIVHAHDTVKVEGAGSRHSGRYYVAGVTHRINTAAHTMDLHLIRNAWDEEPGGLMGALP